MSGDLSSLRERLTEWNFFEECLLHDVRPIKFGFGLDLVINHIWSDGKVRSDALEVPHLVTLRLLGVDSLQFVGGLSKAMKDDPDAINWGLTEIAQVRPFETPPGLGIAVEWERERRLTVEFSDLEFIVSEEAAAQR